jgi:hypothetical protein
LKRAGKARGLAAAAEDENFQDRHAMSEVAL